MRCPSCGLYHPSHYDHCVSCGTQLVAGNSESVRVPVRTAQSRGYLTRQLSPAAGVGIAAAIVVAFAALTFFVLRPSNESVLYEKAQKELGSGQYAFAAKLLEKLVAQNPNDAKIFLSLARAYVGIDQVDRAWSCITRAQQLGAGVIADPALTYQLANYYRQQGSYDRAAQLLRPLAQSNVADARTELSDLDAAWSDAQIDSNIEQAARCWEEIQSLNTGNHLPEAPAKLAVIYQKYADKLITAGDDKAALAVLDKLNALAQNPAYHEMTAGVYERMGLFDKACDQLRTAISLAGPQSELNSKLAVLLTKYGKQLLDSGDAERGYDCLQQAGDLDKTINVPSVVLKDVSVDVNPVDRHAQISASVLNAGPVPVGHVRIEAQLVSTSTSRVLWQGIQSIIGEYDPPLAPQSSKPIKFDSTVAIKSDGSTAFNISLNGAFYKSYLLGKRPDNEHPTSPTGSVNTPATTEIQPGSTTAAQRNTSNKEREPNAPLTPEDQMLRDLER